MMNHMGSFGWWGMGIGAVLMFLFWFFIVLGIIALLRWLQLQSPSGRSARDKTALEIIQERYARGEIDKQEYEQKKRDLGI